MRQPQIYISFMMIACMLTAACDEYEDTPPSPQLVVEGWFNSDGYPEVLLNMSLVPSENENSAIESMIKWGVVTISDGIRTVTLTGGPAPDYFPPFHYYNFEMQGVPGRTYTLTAKYKGLSATSTVTMQRPTPIKRIDVTPVAGCDTLRHVTLHFDAPSDCPAYYHVLSEIHGTDSRALPCMLGTHEVTQPGQSVTIPVYRSNTDTSTTDFQANFPVGTTITITLARISRKVFEFWQAFDNASLVGGSIFVGIPGSLPSNINGGYGVWSPQGVSTATIEVR